ncbi:MAG: PQQ-binding-like beta-propeller repeat protein, partial [Chloroflexota bacterium]|nr:PQQ-binding-like beta-propeller repeat protein [Chloroflexota bacterium]
MKFIRIILIILATLLITATLSACTGRRRLVASGWAGVTTDAESAYMAYNNHVYAIDLANGNERWRYPAEPDTNITFFAPPALTSDGQLIVGGYDSVLYSLNPKNGQVNWKYKEATGRFIAGPLVTESGIFAPSTDQNVYAVDFDNQPLWNPFPTEKEIWASPTADPECECIYVSSMDHHVYAIDAQNGSEIWKTENLGGSIVGTPALSSDQVLYIGSIAKEMVALDTKDGSELWRFPTEDWVWAGPAISEDMLFFGDLSGTFYALNRQSSELVWKIQPGGSIVGTPLVTDDAIYFTNEDGALISVSPEGTIRWQENFDGNTYTAPAAAGDLILVSTSQPE